MRSYNVTPAEVSGALAIQNMEFPSGRLDEGQTETSVRTVGKIQKPEEFNDVVVATRGGYQVKVKDLGYVEDGGEEIRSEARLNGKPAVTLIVSKQSGQNTVAVAREIKDRLKEIQATLPPDFEMRIIGDNSIFIENSLHSIEEHLDRRLDTRVDRRVSCSSGVFASTFIAALAIPTSIISTFALMYAMGYTLNSITMLALTLMVGIVIDDAIVVLENIYRFVEEKGMNPFQAAIEGTREIGLAVLATTLVADGGVRADRIYAGHRRQIHVAFGLTASFAVGVSLIVVFHADADARGTPDQDQRKNRASSETARRRQIDGDGMIEEPKTEDTHYHGWFRHVDSAYAYLLRFSMAHRWVIITLVRARFPEHHSAVYVRRQELSAGRRPVAVRDLGPHARGHKPRADGADIRADRVRDAKAARASPTRSRRSAAAQQQVVNSGTIYVKLSDIGDRSKSQEQLMADAREMLAQKFPTDLRTSVQQVQAFSGGGFRNANMQFMISGPDLKKLEEYSAKILEKMKTIPDAVDVDYDADRGQTRGAARGRPRHGGRSRRARRRCLAGAQHADRRPGGDDV